MVFALLCLLSVGALTLPDHEQAALARRVNRAFLLPFLVVKDDVEGYFGLRSENERLRAMLERRSLEVSELEWTRVENLRLRDALAFRDRQPVELLAAEVIASSDERAPRSFLIDKGTRDGVRANLPVVTPDGLVGKTAEADPNVSVVITIHHPDFRASAMALTESSAETGIVATDPGGDLELVVPMRSTAAEGDAVVTSGIGPVFPRGIPIGRIVDVHRTDRLKLQKSDRVVPAVRLGVVTSVFVVLPGETLPDSPPPGPSVLFWPGQEPPPALAGAPGVDSLAGLSSEEASP